MIRKHNFRTLTEIFEYSTSTFPRREVSSFVEGGQQYTYAQFRDKCENLSRLLSTFGIGAYDKVAILSENMPNWAIAFFATTAYGSISVPMLQELSSNEITNILNHSESKAIFVSKKQLHKLDESVMEHLNLVIDIETFEFIKVKDTSYTCDGRVTMPTPLDTAAIIYTSGTTGNAKGVMLCHRNFCANVLEAWKAYKVRKKDVFMSILPIAHTYEMSIGMLYPFSTGAKVYYLQKMPTPSVLIKSLKMVRPTVMLSVPLIIEKIYKSSVLPTIESSKFLQYLQKNIPWLLHFLVGIKLKKTFGGRIGFFGIGGAKLDPVVEDFLKKVRFPYAIGYGLTETAPLICNASPFKTHVGSTGIAAYGVQIRLHDVNPVTGLGELVVKGNNVMLGYYKDYNRTKEVLSKDGWFHTGDLASMDSKGRYYIKGRMGTVIIGASGENIYPEEIESVINNIESVNESLVVQRAGNLVALVVFNENVIDWNLEGEDKFITDLEEKKKAILEKVNASVNKFSKINSVEIQKEPFIKTATHKIKRFLYEKKQIEKA